MDSLSAWALNTLWGSVAEAMPKLLLRRLYPIKKVNEGINVDAVGRADIWVGESRAPAIKNIQLKFHNHLPITVEIRSLTGPLRLESQVIGERVSVGQFLRVKKNSPAEIETALDLTDSQARVIRACRADSPALTIEAQMVVGAFGETFSVVKLLSIPALIHR